MALKRLAGGSLTRVANPKKKKRKKSTRKGGVRKTARPAYMKKKKKASTKRRSVAAKKAAAARRRRSKTISFKKTVTVPVRGRKTKRRVKVPVKVRISANPGFTVAGLDMAPVAVGAAAALAINAAFTHVKFLNNIKTKLPKAAEPVAPALIAILSGILIHEGAKRYAAAGSYWETLGGYVAAAGLVVGVNKLLEPQLNKWMSDMGGAHMGGEYLDYSGLGGAYLQTDAGGNLKGAYVDVAPAVSGVSGGAGMFAGINNLA